MEHREEVNQMREFLIICMQCQSSEHAIVKITTTGDGSRIITQYHCYKCGHRQEIESDLDQTI